MTSSTRAVISMILRLVTAGFVIQPGLKLNTAFTMWKLYSKSYRAEILHTISPLESGG